MPAGGIVRFVRLESGEGIVAKGFEHFAGQRQGIGEIVIGREVDETEMNWAGRFRWAVDIDGDVVGSAACDIQHVQRMNTIGDEIGQRCQIIPGENFQPCGDDAAIVDDGNATGKRGCPLPPDRISRRQSRGWFTWFGS